MDSVYQPHAFHQIKRRLFARLLINLMRTQIQALLIMATWLWLEEMGYPNIISRLVDISNPAIVNAIADEAISIINCLESETDLSFLLGNDGGLPLISSLTRKSITLHMIYRSRFTAIGGVKSFLHTTCSQIFTDILQSVSNNPFLIPEFSHPIFGNFRAIIYNPLGIYNNVPNGIWGSHPVPAADVTEDNRTMYLTFSKGFPVTEAEVRLLFTQMFGECIEYVWMTENPIPNKQSLFAKLVLRSIDTVDRILNGQDVAKFRINEKHIWARKFQRRGGH